MKYINQLIFLTFLLGFIHCTPKNVNKTMETISQNPTDQEFRKTAPEPTAAPVIHIEDFSDFTLENGLKVIVVENHKRPTVSYSIRVDRDAIFEGDKAGLTQIAGGLINAGTTTRSKAEIDEAIDFIGGNLSASSTRIFGNSLKKHSATLLDLMQDILLNPTFPESEFEKIKKQYKSGIEADMNSPESISSNITDMVVYGKNHPYGEFATVNTIENINLDDVKNYYNTYFKPNISYLVIVGDITLSEAKEQAKKYFGQWKRGDVAQHNYETPTLPDARKVVFVDRPNSVQSVIKVAYPVQLKEGDNDILAARVMNNILGGGVFSGYLMQNLREDKGYTYGARSSLSSDKLVGQFSAYASVRNEVTDSSVVEFLRELNRIRTEPVNVDQLTMVKTNMNGSFSRSLERPESIAEQAFNIFKYDLPKDYYKTYLQRLDKVSVEDVLAAAQKYIQPNNAIISVVGNLDEVASTLNHFSGDGKIDFYNANGDKVEKPSDKEVPLGLLGEQILSNYIKAIGGRLNVFPINSLLWESEVELMGQTLTSVEMWNEPDSYRQAIIMNDIVFQEMIYNQGKGVQKSPQGSAELTGDDLVRLNRQAHAFPDNKYGQWWNYEREAELEIVSITDLDGEDAYRVKLSFSNGDVQYNYYSVESGLKLMESSTMEGPDGQSIVVNKKFSDYKKVGELLYPHTITIEGAGPIPMTFKTTNISVNYEFDEDIFKID